MDMTFPQPLELMGPLTGLNNQLDSSSIEESDLVSSEGFLIDEAGHPYTLFNYDLKVAAEFVCSAQDPRLPFVMVKGVAGLSLYRVNEDLTLTGIRSGMTPTLGVSFVKHRDYVYYSNGHENGRIKDNTSFIWPEKTEKSRDQRIFSSAPVGPHIEVYLGQMVISQDDTIYFSLDPHNFVLHENFIQFPAPVIMVRGTSGALFVSTTEKVYSIVGVLKRDSFVSEVSQTPAIEWSDSAEPIDGYDIDTNVKGTCVAWVCTDSACIGYPTGEIQKVSKPKIRYPLSVRKASSLLINRTLIHSF